MWGSGVSGGAYTPLSNDLIIQYIAASETSFVGHTSTGAVVSWGLSSAGGDSSAVSNSLGENVKIVSHTTSAFAALKFDGSVVVWGDASSGGDSSAVANMLSYSNITQVLGNAGAFAALTAKGRVLCWGSAQFGGSMNVSSFSNVTALTTTGVVS
eukprot:gene37210-45910_t